MAESISGVPKLPWMIDFYSTKDGHVPKFQLKAAYAKNFLNYKTKLNIESKILPKHLTSIACTVGQSSSNNIQILQDMMRAGMSMAVIKLALYTAEEWIAIVKIIREAVDLFSIKIGMVYPLTIAVELKGSDIRTGIIKNPEISEIELEKGNTIVLTTDPAYEEHVTEDMIYVDYQKITEIVIPGDNVYLDNKINLSALEIVGSIIRCIVETAGKLANRASVSIPAVPIDLPFMSERDLDDIKVCIEQKIDVIIVPGVRGGENVVRFREQLETDGRAIFVISKIDNVPALFNVDDIIKQSDGIMLDREALCVEMPQEKLMLAQKSVIAKCLKVGKPSICGPNMLATMETANRPSKAEIVDVSNAILDGADCLLLCRETATGSYPVESIETLVSICKEAEPAVYQKQLSENLACKTKSPVETLYAIGLATVDTSLKCNAAAIIVLTTSGKSAKIISRFRPRCPVLAITRLAPIARQLYLYRAVIPIYYWKPPVKPWKDDIDRRVQLALTYGKYTGFIRAGDAIVIVHGSRPSSGFTNVIQVVYASEFDTIVASM